MYDKYLGIESACQVDSVFQVPTADEELICMREKAVYSRV